MKSSTEQTFKFKKKKNRISKNQYRHKPPQLISLSRTEQPQIQQPDNQGPEVSSSLKIETQVDKAIELMDIPQSNKSEDIIINQSPSKSPSLDKQDELELKDAKLIDIDQKDYSDFNRLQQEPESPLKKYLHEKKQDVQLYMYRKSKLISILAHFMQEAYILTTKNKNIVNKFDDLNQDNTLFQGNFNEQKFTQFCDKIVPLTLKRCFSSIPVFEPQSKGILIWDTLQLMIIILILIWIPYSISFEVSYQHQIAPNNISSDIRVLLFLLLICDFIIQFNVAIIVKGNMITNRRDILNYFAHTFLFFEVLSIAVMIINFFYIHELKSFSIITMIIFLICKTHKINQIKSKIEEILNLHGFSHQNLTLINNLLIMIFLIHIMGCIWHGIAYYSSGQQNWLDAHNLTDLENWTKYNHSIYWVIMILTNIGSSDIQPVNDRELVFANCWSVLSCGIFAYFINVLRVIFKNNESENFKKTISLINRYMKKNHVNSSLQSRIRGYLDYFSEQEKQKKDQEVSLIINKLSSELQEELIYNVRGRYLYKIPYFQNYSKIVIQRIAQIMQEENYSPEQEIISQNDQNQDLFLIHQGTVQVLYKSVHQSRSLQYLKTGEYFGQVSFFTSQVRSATVESIGFTKVFRIEKSQFLSIVREYAKEYELFSQAKDDFHILCYICHKPGHVANKCRLVHFIPNFEGLIKKYQYPIIQQSRKFNRKIKKKVYIRTFIGLLTTQIRAQEFQNEFETDQDQEQNDSEGQNESELVEDIDELGGLALDNHGGYQESTHNRFGTDIKLQYRSTDEQPLKLNMFPSVDIESVDIDQKFSEIDNKPGSYTLLKYELNQPDQEQELKSKRLKQSKKNDDAFESLDRKTDMKKKSLTNTKTRKSFFEAFQEMDQHLSVEWGVNEFERVQSFQIYQFIYNYEIVVLKANRALKNYSKSTFSKSFYTFNIPLIKKIERDILKMKIKSFQLIEEPVFSLKKLLRTFSPNSKKKFDQRKSCDSTKKIKLQMIPVE